MSGAPDYATFTGLINLASDALGAHAVACTDDFFASMHNLVKPGRGVWREGEYTDRGKWMDGWESRRRRDADHDWCVVALGAQGVIRAVDIDTNHFLGNHPPFASLEATRGPLEEAEWIELLPQSPLRPGAQNLFTVRNPNPFTHVRLHLHPDGGVARLRVWGEVEPRWGAAELDEETGARVRSGEVDLAAIHNGGLALAYFG